MNRKTQIGHPQNGFSLVEVMIAIAVLGIVSSIGVSAYTSHAADSKASRAISELRMIDLLIKDYGLTTRRLPPNLAALGIDYTDPWGNDYEYLDISSVNGNGTRRGDTGDWLNTDFDLYSLGPDGTSVGPLTSSLSRDDFIRANNGEYVGTAEGY
jgi:general secretion pathway protein G